MKYSLRQVSLTKKILLLPLVTILLMALGLCTAAAIAVQNSYETRVRRIIEQTMAESSRYVSAELRNTVALVHYSLLDDPLRQALTTDLSGDLAQYIEAQDIIVSRLTRLQAQGRFIESAALTVQGRLFCDGIHSVDYDTTPLVEAARLRGLAYWSESVILNRATGRDVIPMVLRVPSGDFSSKNEVYILINLNAQTLFSYIAQLEKTLECSLILHSGDSVLYDKDGIYSELNGTDYIINDTLLDINDWSICCVMSRNQLYASRNEALAHMLLAALVVTVLCVALAAPVAQNILLPVRSLTKAAGQVAEGDYTVNIDITGGDELSQLGCAFNTMTDQINQNIQALEEKNRQILLSEQQKRRAEMRALQAQINPHFLYNTLDSVYWYALSGRQKETGTLVETLSDMLRIALSKGAEYIPLEKELRHVEDYLRIQSTIFPNRFTYTICQETQTDYRILKILLQPLAENSINHGFENMEQGGEIFIHVWDEEEFLCLSVADNGCGFEQSKQQGIHKEYSGFALQNLSERLAVHYSDDATLNIHSVPFQDTCVEIRIRRQRCLGGKEENDASSFSR